MQDVLESHRHGREGNSRHKLLGEGVVRVDLSEIGHPFEDVLRELVSEIRACERSQHAGRGRGRKSSTTATVDKALEQLAAIMRNKDLSGFAVK